MEWATTYLVVEIGEVGDQVLEDIHVREGVDFGGGRALVDVRQAGQRVGPVDVHGARPADALPARPDLPIRQWVGWVGGVGW